ncbi:hypothetical protein HKCCSP123_10625 [Rhodobacterales bacterium HKCCSP123]|nr:hypothetical protein [Rhodobacterales bacterium HKCCSP123]
MSRPRHVLRLAALVLALAGPAAAQVTDCAEGQVAIGGAPPALAEDLCRISHEAITTMTACSLGQTRPIRVDVVDEVPHPFATCLAAFDCDYDRVRIVIRDDYAGLVEAADPYAQLPPEVLVRTLLTHELAHALVFQTAAGREIALTDHEYIAAAMELEQMHPEWRALVLDAAGFTAPAEGRINIWIYRMSPRRFSANAWLHFKAPGNGCALVGDIIAGRRSFETDPR